MSATPSPSPPISETLEPSPSPSSEESESLEHAASPEPAASAWVCPEPVTSVQATPGNNSVTVSWGPPANASEAENTGYYLQVASTGRIIRVEGDTLRTQVTGLRNGVAESFLVYADTEHGRSEAADPVTATPTSGMEGEVAGLIVKFAGSPNLTDGQSDVPGKDKVSSVDLTVDTKIAADVHLIELSEAVSTEQADQVAAELQSDPSVEWAEPDVFVFPSSVPSDPEYESSQWNLWDEWGLGLPRTSSSTTTSFDPQAGAGVTVAVIDTGITSHPDLDSQLVPGYDFVSDPTNLAAPRVEGGPNVGFDADGQPGRDADPTDPGDWRGVAPTRDSTWHGTLVAGVIAAQAGNSEGIVGVAPGAKIQPVRALSWRGGLMSDIISSITWASGGSVDGAPANANPSDVITMSFAANAQCSVALQTAIDYANERGSVLVAAAGNANDDVFGYAPANCADVIAVGATGRDGKRAPYSNYGPGVDISAPGGSLMGAGGVLSTSNSGTQAAQTANYRSGEGTSIAAAHVAGALARVKSDQPELSADELRARFLSGEQVRAFPDQQCDVDPNINCGTGLLALARPETQTIPGVTGPDLYGDVKVDCNQLSGSHYLHHTVSQSFVAFIDTKNYANCSFILSENIANGGEVSGSQRYTLPQGSNTTDSIVITRTSTGARLTISRSPEPVIPEIALSTTSVTGVIGESITPITNTAANYTPNMFSVTPNLPAGLLLDLETGEVTGVPTSAQGFTQYTITGSDGNQEASVSISIGILAEPPLTVTFKQDVGMLSRSISVESGQSIVLPKTQNAQGQEGVTLSGGGSALFPIVKDSHLFGGWYSDPGFVEGSYVGIDGDSYTPSADVSLHAKWIPARDICFRQASSTINGEVTIPATWVTQWTMGYPTRTCTWGTQARVPADTEFNLPVPTRANAGFHGWYSQAQATNSSSTSGTLRGRGGALHQVTFSSGNVLTYHSQWQTSSFRINFDPGLGVSRDVFGSAPCEAIGTTDQCGIRWNPGDSIGSDGRAAVEAPSPTRDGWQFKGWFTSSSGGTRLGGGGDLISGAANDTLRAQWTEVVPTATVTFDANAGGMNDPGPVTAEVGSTIDLPQPTRTGFTLLGWVLTLGGEPVADPYTVTGDVTLIAQWEAVTAESPVSGGQPRGGPPEEAGPPVVPPRLDVRPPRIELDTPVRPTPARPAAVVIDGEEVELVVERDEDNTELDVIGDDFSLTVATSDTERTRIAPSSRRTLVAPVRGFVELSAAGYAPQSMVGLYLVPTLSGRMSLRNASELYFLGEASVGEDQSFVGEFRIPDWALPGEYSLQINGYTPAGALKSINVRLDLIDKRADAVSVARACVFPEDSVQLTPECRQSLRSLKQILPDSVDTLTIDITGVAYAQGSKKKNREVALERAERVERFLERNGIAGDVTVDVVTKKGMAPGLALGPPPVVTADNGKPASTVVMTVEWTTEIGPEEALAEMGGSNNN